MLCDTQKKWVGAEVNSTEDRSRTSRIVLVAHDPGWAEEFARESTVVALGFGDLLVELHHIGSTAIPGIEAKPVIDMLAVVTDIGLVDVRSPRLEELGYEAMGEFGIPGRRYFRKNSPSSVRTHQIHSLEVGSPEIERHLAFRDFLRAHPEHAKKYAAVKREMGERYPHDMAAYTDGKSEFIREMEGRAAWRDEIE